MSAKRQKTYRIALRAWLEAIHLRYHRRELIGTDPLQFVYRYRDPGDQEIAGLIAASLAYGNVVSINKSVSRVLDILGPSPRAGLLALSPPEIRMRVGSFYHRWTNADVMSDFLGDVRAAIQAYGSLGRCFAACDHNAQDITVSLSKWVGCLRRDRPLHKKELLSDPDRKSACKRLHLFLRWMVRSDEIDPGCWKGIDPARLKWPIDTHIYQFCRAAGITTNNSVNAATVNQVTGFFREICPVDPVKYDFALTRPGIIDGWKPSKSMAGALESLTLN